MRAIRSVALWLAMAGVAAATLAESESAQRKFERIETGRAVPGSRIDFTPGELNQWTRDQAHARVPRGVRNVRLELGAGRVTGYADIDFLKLRQTATREPPGWLMQNLFAGERPVVVTARVQSGNGRARVDVERVEVSGVPIEGAALDFLIENFVRPQFPDARVSEWFHLSYHVDHFTVSPAGLSVFVGGQRMVASTRPESR
ncbi:MAG: hypothetical protein ABSB15_14700 [Bryobacteraceae bacterium]